MALLDVSSILLDPDFVDSFNVRRRNQTIDAHGRAAINETIFSKVFGVVTAISPSDLDRKDNYEAMSRSISIVCQFHLRGETTDYQPDIVVWKGSNYLVKHVDPYPQFGMGFFQVECTSIDKTDPAFEPLVTGRFTFNQAPDAVNVPLLG